MPNCEKLEKCPFFADRLANMPTIAEVLKKQYCLGDKTTCARYIVSLAGKPVPSDLFPNQTSRIPELLKREC
jgi:methyl-accepting chemotaxis protein